MKLKTDINELKATIDRVGDYMLSMVLIMSKIECIKNNALRFGDHVLQHTVSANNNFSEQCRGQVWRKCLISSNLS